MEPYNAAQQSWWLNAYTKTVNFICLNNLCKITSSAISSIAVVSPAISVVSVATCWDCWEPFFSSLSQAAAIKQLQKN